MGEREVRLEDVLLGEGVGFEVEFVQEVPLGQDVEVLLIDFAERGGKLGEEALGCVEV
jgi:hypothetical protein